MKLSKLLSILSIAIFGILLLSCGNQQGASLSDHGEKIVRELWKNMKSGNITEIEDMLDKGFQSVHQDGSRGYDEEIELIKGLNMSEYTLNDFKVTKTGPVIIVTYFVTVQETIDNLRLEERRSSRLSAFIKRGKGYKWFAHANLNPIK